MDAVEAVRRAVLAKLTADLAPVGVHEHPPQDMKMPSVTLDRVFDEPDDLLFERQSKVTLTMTMWSAKRGSREAEAIRSGIYASLHNADLALASGGSVMCRYVRGDVTRDADGVTYIGSVLITALVEH